MQSNHRKNEWTNEWMNENRVLFGFINQNIQVKKNYLHALEQGTSSLAANDTAKCKEFIMKHSFQYAIEEKMQPSVYDFGHLSLDVSPSTTASKRISETHSQPLGLVSLVTTVLQLLNCI